MNESFPVKAGPVVGRSRRNTWVLVVFTSVTNLADGITKVALPLVATSLTSSPALVSGVLLSLTVPWLLIALPVGVLVDRANRRSLIALAGAARLVAVIGLLAAHGSGDITLPMLYGAGTLLGVAEVVALTSSSAIVPDAVAPADRERVNTWITAAETVANEFAGPSVGGLLMATGTAIALSATTVGYGLGIAVLALLFGQFRVERNSGQPNQTVREQVAEGVAFLWHHHLLRMLSLTVAVLITCWSAWLALMPLVATTSLGLSAGGYGVLVGTLGVGGLTGTLLVRTANGILGRRRVMFTNVFFTCSMVAVPAVTTHVWAIGCAAFLGGLGGTLWTVNSRTISQVLVHRKMMGRWSAANRLFSWGSIPLGTALAGALAQGFGPRVTFGVFAATTAVVIVPFLRIFTPEVLRDLETRLKEAADTPAG